MLLKVSTIFLSAPPVNFPSSYFAILSKSILSIKFLTDFIISPKNLNIPSFLNSFQFLIILSIAFTTIPVNNNPPNPNILSTIPIGLFSIEDTFFPVGVLVEVTFFSISRISFLSRIFLCILSLLRRCFSISLTELIRLLLILSAFIFNVFIALETGSIIGFETANSPDGLLINLRTPLIDFFAVDFPAALRPFAVAETVFINILPIPVIIGNAISYTYIPYIFGVNCL